MNTCRFCKKMVHRDFHVKYGVRHYAHFDCYLDAGKDLFRLSRWQVDQFPRDLLKKRGLLDRVESIKRCGDLLGNW